MTASGCPPNDTAAQGIGRYADGRTFRIPAGWTIASEDTLTLATTQALRALEVDDGFRRLAAYYDPDSNYAGTLFLDATPNDPRDVAAADLWAVATLSIPVHALQARRLLHDPGTSAHVHRQLTRLAEYVPITDLEDAVTGEDGRPALDVMWDLHDTFRTLLSHESADSNRWVFAAKLCARKRPLLYPVRDNLVCSYLSGGKPLGPGAGQLGRFGADLQVYAWLMTHDKVRDALSAVHTALTEQGVRVDETHLRLLDAALWTKAKWRQN